MESKHMPPQLTDPDFLQALLRKHGLVPQHSAGQNFLICEEPLEAILTALEESAQRVTELGSGLGPLTAALVGAGYHVRAIEQDRQLAEILPTLIPAKLRDKVEVTIGDLREIAWEWVEPWQLVGNIPYNLSGYILRRLTQLPSPPTQAILMVQREVGERLAATAPDMNLLGLAAQLWGTPHPLLSVPRSCFWPSPEVDSAVILVVPHGPDGANKNEREAVLKIAKVFFQHKRKQMGGVLRRDWHVEPARVETLLGAVGVNPTARPQEVSVAQWRVLTLKLEAMKLGS